MTDVLERIEPRSDDARGGSRSSMAPSVEGWTGPLVRLPAHEAMRRCVTAQAAWAPPGVLRRIVGADPLGPEGRRWYATAHADRRFARALEIHASAVLHSVPIGIADDIDHLVVDAGGVVAVTVVDEGEAKVDVRDGELRIDGVATRILDRSLEIREDVASRLGVALARKVPVESVVVVLARHRPVEGERAPVAVLTEDQLERWLDRREPRLTEAEVAELVAEAGRASTWRNREEVAGGDEEFVALERAVASARRRRLAWQLAAMALIVGGLAAVATGLPELIGGLLAR